MNARILFMPSPGQGDGDGHSRPILDAEPALLSVERFEAFANVLESEAGLWLDGVGGEPDSIVPHGETEKSVAPLRPKEDAALAGLLAGFSVRGVVPGRGFMGGRVVAMGAVPLIVGLTYPMVTLGLWPFTMLGGRVLDVLLTPELALVAWVLVGLSLSIGLVADREII